MGHVLAQNLKLNSSRSALCPPRKNNLGGRGIGRDDLRNRLRNGVGTGKFRADAVARRDRRPSDEHDVDNAPSGVVVEPEAKRPRVTSTIVVLRGGGDALDNGRGRAAAAAREDGELDRWDAGGGGVSDEVDGHAESGGIDVEVEAADDGGKCEEPACRRTVRGTSSVMKKNGPPLIRCGLRAYSKKREIRLRERRR